LDLPVRGRANELAVLDATLRDLGTGRGAIFLVDGAPGIGKTRILQEAEQRAIRAGMTVAAGSADEIGTVAPLTPLLSALTSGDPPVVEREQLRALERPGDQRFWLLEELAEILELRSRETPLLVTIDDLHWADDATVWALAMLGRRLLPYPIGWMLAMRPSQTPGPVQRLIQELIDAGATQLELGRLEQTEIEAMASDALGSTLDARLQQLLTGAAGNPFLGLELVKSLLADGSVVVEDGRAQLRQAGTSAQFHERVRSRFIGLDPEVTQFLGTASVFGNEFSLADVAAVRHVSSAILVSSVEAALRAEVLEDRDGRLRFRHDLLRQAILEEVHPSSLKALHREAANAILARGGSAVEAAAHLVAYAEPGDRQAIRVLQEAAVSVAATAPGPASDLMLRAVDLMTPEEPGWLDAVIGTIGLLAWATRFTQANELAARALARKLDPLSEGLVRLGVSEALLLAARRVDLIDQAEEALARPDLPDELRGHFLHNLAQGLGQDGQVDAAERAFRESLELVGSDNESLALSCQIGLGLMTALRGHLDEGLALADACVAACEAAGPEAQQRMPHLSKAAILAALDRFDEAAVALDEATALATRLGAAWALEFTQRTAVAQKWSRGLIADAAVEAEAVLAMADALDLWHDTDIPLGVLGLAAFHRNDLADAAAQVQRAIDSGSRYSRTPPPRWAYVEALLIDAHGAPGDAVAVLYDVYDQPDALIAALAIDGTVAPTLVRLAQRGGDRVRANRVVAAIGWLARENPHSPAHRAGAHHSLGLLDNNAEELVKAAESLRDSPRLLAKASAFEDAGRALVQDRDRERGTRYLVYAFEQYSELGATRDEARVRQRLRDSGVRRRPRTRVARASVGWESLTPAELRVTGLVADGLTNRKIAERLFLSPYTIATHLKHIFTKLDVSTRAELTRVATRHEAMSVT
jgi:ATP/maltotriose-dependent transcriptional regulator MalT